jgi:hypothetical protein
MTMVGISLKQDLKTLRKDSLAGLGVTIKDIELRCKAYGESYMLPVPSETGNFPSNWNECPRGCNNGKDLAA